ncbi:L,D-transpeptidase family protein [Massilia sp. TSP1-1-2]|uniref:L,D-transpeptidase family protein n=1 Tax=Massilia sp. TSP1-1-2 TaxID=2804649 RepID=UPI003CEB090E
MKHPSLCMIAACLAGAALAPAQAAPAKTTVAKSAPAPTALAPTVLNAETVNAAGKGAPTDGKPDSATILRAQVLLDRAHFASGEIDGAAGSNVKMALVGFQRKNAIKETGTLDAATWTALNADPAPALATYTLADVDVAGPFTPIPEDMAAKAKLPTLGYASALEGLGEKFHASTKLLQKLNPDKDLTKVGEQILVPNVLDTEPLPKAGKIVVDKSDRTLALLDASGKLIAQFPSSSGTDKDPLPIGTWKVNGVSKNPKFHYNPKLFWDADAGEKKATIPSGPNNPVGVAWIDLSKPHYGIHGTPVPGSIGKTQSHGCIRLTNWDVQTVTASVGPGTEVLLQE